MKQRTIGKIETGPAILDISMYFCKDICIIIPEGTTLEYWEDLAKQRMVVEVRNIQSRKRKNTVKGNRAQPSIRGSKK